MLKTLALLSLVFAPFSHAVLPEPIAQAARASGISAERVAFWSAPVGAATSVEHNSNAAFNPASVMKLVTSMAALDLLGPTYSWQTDALLQGELKNGVLQGNLILRGGGDPALTWDRFGIFLRELRSRGLREIRGDVLIDRSLFNRTLLSDEGKNPFDDQPQRAYNATPDPLLLNFKALSLRLTPSRQTVDVGISPPLAPVTLDNQLQTTDSPCGDWRGNLSSELVPQAQGGILIRLRGKLPSSCGEKVLNLAFHDGVRFSGLIFRALWAELGGSLSGQVRDTPSTPSDLAVFASNRSPALAEVLRDMNKYSNNVMARQVFLSLSSTAPWDSAQAEQRLRGWLAERQIELPGLVIENGSGLSRRERITAAGLGKLLQRSWSSTRMPELVSSLPIAGSDGTARRRFSNQNAAGSAWLKTGSLNDVMSIAGYVIDQKGNWQVLVIIINDLHAEAGAAITTAATDWVWRGKNQ